MVVKLLRNCYVNAGNTTNGICNFGEVIWHYIAGTISNNYYYESFKRINRPVFIAVLSMITKTWDGSNALWRVV